VRSRYQRSACEKQTFILLFVFSLNNLIAAGEGNIAQVKRLIENGVDPNMGDYDRRTALHLASAEVCVSSRRSCTASLRACVDAFLNRNSQTASLRACVLPLLRAL
jgi:ankyrin repeat protein